MAPGERTRVISAACLAASAQMEIGFYGTVRIGDCRCRRSRGLWVPDAPPYSQCPGGDSLRFAMICGKSATVRIPGGASQT